MSETKKTDAKKTGSVWEALVAFQSDCDLIVDMDREVSFNATKYKYASLPNIIKKIRGPLTKNNLAFFQQIKSGHVVTIVVHGPTGQTFSGVPVPITPNYSEFNGKMQDLGARITYARRYSLTTTLGIVADEDIDSPDIEAAKNSRKFAYDTAKKGIETASDIKTLTEKCDFIKKQLVTVEKGKTSSLGLSKEQLKQLLALAEERFTDFPENN